MRPSISVMWMELGPLVRCPCGGVSGQPPTGPASGHIHAGSDLWPDIPPTLVARLLWQRACSGCLTVVGSFVFGLLLLFWAFRLQRLLCHHPDTGVTVSWSEATDTWCSGCFCVTLERSLFWWLAPALQSVNKVMRAVRMNQSSEVMGCKTFSHEELRKTAESVIIHWGCYPGVWINCRKL